MKDLLENLDSTIFTPELKGEIHAKFAGKIADIEDKYKIQLEEATSKIAELEKSLDLVEASKVDAEKSIELVTEQLEAKAENYGKYISEEYEAKAEEYTKYVTEQLEAKADAYIDLIKEDLAGTVSSYLDKVVETYVNENRISIDESVEIEKAKAMLEGLDSIIYTAGKSVIEIQESMSDKKTDSTVAELKAKIDSLVKENNTLKESQKTKEKENILEEVAKDLTLVQRDSFDRLAKIVSLNESDMGIYRASLEKIKGEVVGKVEESLNEKVQDKTPEKNHKRFF